MTSAKLLSPEAYTLEHPPQTQVATNFRLHELTRSSTAQRLGIDNSFARLDHLHAAIYLARNVLQPLRDRFGRYTPNSVYRCQALERAIKGRPSTWRSRSQHTRGQAADVSIVGCAPLKVARWISENIAFDQLIVEFYVPGNPGAGWSHVSVVDGPDNRNQILTYNGHSYTQGFPA